MQENTTQMGVFLTAKNLFISTHQPFKGGLEIAGCSSTIFVRKTKDTYIFGFNRLQ